MIKVGCGCASQGRRHPGGQTPRGAAENKEKNTNALISFSFVFILIILQELELNNIFR
jgi:hypothetical protein